MKNEKPRDQDLISCWLLIGGIMVFVQILLGGITRLTGSGLSITRWDIVMGAVPPLNVAQWDEAFQMYKETPQYQHINRGMEISEFKFIFFWEFLHRLWARAMGFVFLIPFIYFLFRKSINRQLLKNLGLVIILAGLAAIFGWIMVVSGLIERPWVNAYKLTIHLSLGILLFLALFYTWLNHRGYKKLPIDKGWQKAARIIFLIGGIQFLFGGLVSGMKSAMMYPTWPLMNEHWLPSIILDSDHWSMDNLLLYDKSGFMPALVQFIHRNLAYLLIFLFAVFIVKWLTRINRNWRWIAVTMCGIIVVQVSLGILILMNSIGHIPVLYGSLHQAVGILLITFLFYLNLILKHENIK